MTSENKSLSGIPRWDGKEGSCSTYMAVLEAIAEYQDCEDAFDTNAMRNCPTKSEYDALAATTTDVGEMARRSLWKANKKMCAFFTLGQDSALGLAVIQKTKTVDFPQGVIHQVMTSLMGRNKPKDASAEIRLDAKLDAIKFTTGRKYYDDQVEVLAQFDIGKSNTELVKLLAKKVGNPTYAKLVIDHLNDIATNHDILTICTAINEVQELI